MSFVWSYSALNTFETCPRKFYHQYIMKQKEPDSPVQAWGNLIHRAGEQFVKTGVVFAEPKLAGFYPFFRSVRALHDSGLTVLTEFKMGLTKTFVFCDFFGKEVWGRAVLDVVALADTTAFIIDWKSGKMREKPDQLAISALFLFRRFPEIQKVVACNIWLEAGKIGDVYEFTRAQEPALWAPVLQRIQEIEHAIAKEKFPMMPGWACGYCFEKTCPNNRNTA